MKTKTINIAKDFSPQPIGRYPEDSDFSGTRFRDEFLLPAIKSNDSVIVEWSGIEGLGASWIQEAFGGLILIHGLDHNVLKEKFLFKTDRVSKLYAALANDYMSIASRGSDEEAAPGPIK